MDKRKYIVLLIMGILFIIIGIIISQIADIEVKNITGILYGLGAGASGMSVAKIIENRYFLAHPDKKEEEKIERMDERNILLRNRAKAKAGDITDIVLIVVAFISIVAKTELWITLLFICIYVFHFIMQMVYLSKYQKEM